MSRQWRRALLLAEFALAITLQIYAITAAFARHPPIVPAGRAFSCTPTRVWDGDGPIWCREGPRLRLANIATREIDGHCRPGQPCPTATGVAARDQLVALLGGARGRTADGHVLVAGPALACRSAGPDKYNRTVARCRDGTRDIGAELVRRGAALPWRVGTGRN